MGFALLLTIIFLILISVSTVAFHRKKKLIGIIALSVMIFMTAFLGYLWFTSPM